MNQLPEVFELRMKNRIPEEEFSEFISAYENKASVCIRLNSKKKISAFDDFESLPWLDSGKYLEEKRLFITDPNWHAGTYYVQEPSSMILADIYKRLFPENGPKSALDLCAAPGGKSTLLQELLDDEAILVANEVIKPRAQILKENHIRLGLNKNLVITQNDPKDFKNLPGIFDYIQIDAPCSGEGMFRKDEIAVKEWSEANCQLCSERQRRILADILPTLSKDGFLVYSTCTFNPAENEENCYWASNEFDLEPVQLDFPKKWEITEVNFKGIFGYYFYPHNVKGEGLFISVLKKKTGLNLLQFQLKRKKQIFKIPELKPNENLVEKGSQIVLETDELHSFLNEVRDTLTIVYAGIEIGEKKGKDFIPTQALANYHQKLHNFPEIEVNLKQALSFLRGEDPDLEIEKKGIYLLTYEKFGIGWIKNIGNRANNYYPKPWRIKNY